MTVAYSQTAWTTEPLHRRSRNGGKLSLIIPMHNECAALGALFERLDTVLPPLGIAVEIVCVDDGSTDETLDVLAVRAAADPRVKVIALSRNFGKEAAPDRRTRGCDGGRPRTSGRRPAGSAELMAEFLTLWEQGFDVVYGVRTDRSSDTRFKRRTAALFYRLFNAIFRPADPHEHGRLPADGPVGGRGAEEASRTQSLHEGPVLLGRISPGGRALCAARSLRGGTSLATWFFGAPGADGLTASAPLRSESGPSSAPRARGCAALCRRPHRPGVGRRPGCSGLRLADGRPVVRLRDPDDGLRSLGRVRRAPLRGEVKGRPIYIVRQRIGFGS